MSREERIRCDAPGCTVTTAPSPAVDMPVLVPWVELRVDDDGAHVRTLHGCKPAHAVEALRAALKVNP